ncbi:MAG TPA: choice-of-anchor D domain-containing protein, partial [Planctomycetota bacterium]|nr:choice-of-anchor D domain-containing protein [Planctomycetota bacterium]
MKKSSVHRIAAVLALVGAAFFLARGTPRRQEATTTPLASMHQAPPAPAAAQTAESDDPIAEPAAPAGHAVDVDLGVPAKIQRSEPGLVRAGNDLCTQEFTKDGVRLSTAGGELAWSLRDLRLGQQSLLDGGSAEPTLHGDKAVSYRRSSVTESYALRGDGVEQTFILDEQLASLRKQGPLTLTVSLKTALKPVAERRGDEEVVDLRDRAGKTVLTYGGATAIDAAGRRQRLSYRLRGSDLEMMLDAGFLASATFPLTVDPIISVTPTSLTFYAPLGGPNPLPKVVKLKNADVAGSGQMSWTVTDNAPWLTVKPGKGKRRPGMSKNLTVSVNVTGLAVGIYTGTITITSPTASNSPQTVTVTLRVNDGPTILVDPPALVFNSPDVGPNPVPQFMTLQNVGAGILNWTAASVVATPPAGTWLSVSPSSGALRAGETVILSVLINHAGLASGTYTASVNVTDAVFIPTPTPGSVAVTLNVSNLPKVGLAPTSLSFDGAAASPGVPTPAVPAPQQVTLTNSGAGTLVWTLSSVTVPAAGTWLTVNPAGGSLNAGESIPLDVSVNQGTNPTGLVAGTYTATVTVTNGTSTGTFDVAFNVNDLATISLDPTALTFNAPDIGPDPVFQPVTLTNSGTAALDWTATTIMQGGQTWLSVTPASGSLPAGGSVQLAVSVNHGVLAAGTYTANIDIADTTGNATNPDELIDVTLNVSNTPKLAVSETLLSFQAPDIGPDPGSQTFTVTNSGGGSLSWTSAVALPVGQNWLSVTPSGSTLNPQELST